MVQHKSLGTYFRLSGPLMIILRQRIEETRIFVHLPMEFPEVLILRKFPFISSFEDRFSKKFRSIKAWGLSIQERNRLLTENAQSVKSLICGSGARVTSETLDLLPSLGCVVTTSAGVDHIDLTECQKRGIVVGNAGSVYSEDVADLTVGLLIDVFRRITLADRFVRSGQWSLKGEYPLGTRLGGKRLGIIGLGSIGSEVAKRFEALGCIISYNSRTKKPSFPFPYYSNVLDLATNSDVLIVCCELNKETYHVINKDILSALGKEGVVINVGRGALVDEKELVRCLMQREIAGAGLDVFEKEPNVPKELLELDNVVLSPHNATHTHESLWEMHELLTANLEAFFSNKPLPALVKYE